MKINCTQCNKEFNKKPSLIAKDKTHFCGKKCLGDYRKTGSEFECTCGKMVYRSPAEQKKTPSGQFYCSMQCRNGNQQIGEKSHNWKDGSSNYRARAIKQYGAQCHECGYSKYEQVLQVHHIDHKRSNNEINNLVVLCPTCHSVEHLVKYNSLNDKPPE